ncbi:PAS domain-containing sensor histidine kinase [Janthinobacterium sp. RB2R34]|uniref:PAS domain-containing sensor histidine kinase n=1 Tax=Janthinobacterium sp. RB2R34 TaxID=3424193 RepID=UPI003F264BBB
MAYPSFHLLQAACIAILAMAGLVLAAGVYIVLLRRQSRASSARHRELSESIQDGAWETDASGRIVAANRRMGEMLGLTEAQLVGRHVSDFFNVPTLQRLCPMLRTDLPGPARLLQYQRADGATAWAMVGGKRLLDAHGRLCGSLTIATDVTAHHLAQQALVAAHAGLEQRIALRTAQLQEANAQLAGEVAVRRQAEQALLCSETRLREIIAMLPLALFLKTAESKVILMNEACEQQWGIALDELTARTEECYYTPEQLQGFREDDRQAFAQRRVVVREDMLWNSHLQQYRQVQTHKKALFDEHGQPQMIIGMGIDITEHRRNEEALRLSLLQLRELSDHQESIKEAERRRIALDIHDDLGQSLMVLKIDASLLHARTGEKHARLRRHTQRALAAIDASIAAVREIINDLYPSTLELGLVPAVEWLVRQMHTLGDGCYHLTLDNPDTGQGLDRRKTAALFRVIEESLLNSLRHARARTVEVTLGQCASQVAVCISDDGIGMQPGDDGKRAAFGLKNMRERMHALGGTIAITSGPGQGTTLEIRLPYP